VYLPPQVTVIHVLSLILGGRHHIRGYPRGAAAVDGAVQLHHPPVAVREPGVPEVRLQHAVRVGRADVRPRH
jgi:hypothetical protein